MPSDSPEEQERLALQRARALLTRRRGAADRASKIAPTITIAALTALAFALTLAFDRDERASEYSSADAARCADDDSACLGARIISQIQEPCSRAVEAQLQQPPEWSDSAWERRFHSPAWYRPPDQLIFYGSRATVKNTLGGQLTPSYFCVVTREGALIRATLRDLP